jgi:K+-transporting ATPase ATPase C chain
MKTLIRPAVSLFVALTAVTGIAYPLAVTGLTKVAFPEAAAGSLIVRDGQAVGSSLIGQNFSDLKYFWGRPSATSPQPYNASASGGSNQGPLNPALVDAVKGRIAALKAADPDNPLPIPADLVTASASGLDPHVSPEAAAYQINRVAGQRHLLPADVKALVGQNTEGRQWGIFGEPRINVLQLNLALDSRGR